MECLALLGKPVNMQYFRNCGLQWFLLPVYHHVVLVSSRSIYGFTVLKMRFNPHLEELQTISCDG